MNVGVCTRGVGSGHRSHGRTARPYDAIWKFSNVNKRSKKEEEVRPFNPGRRANGRDQIERRFNENVQDRRPRGFFGIKGVAPTSQLCHWPNGGRGLG